MKCPKCDKNPANKHELYGVMPCDECVERGRGGRKRVNKWWSDRKLLDHAATPFWRHMGLEPKPEELRQEKYMKWKGLSYGDMQRIRNSGKNARHDNSKLINKALEGKLKRGRTSNYGKQGPSRD